MILLDDHKIYESYLLTELFNSFYNLNKIKGRFSAGIEQTFTNFNQLFSYHIKYKDKNPIYNITCYFNDKDNNTIEVGISPSTINSNIFDENVLETFIVSFGLKKDPYKMKLDSHNTISVVSSVMNCILMFLNAYKSMINNTTNDWSSRTQKGIITFSTYPNISMNEISKQSRYKKERDRGFSQRENIYKAAFNKIIKPLYPELSIIKIGEEFLIKS